MIKNTQILLLVLSLFSTRIASAQTLKSDVSFTIPKNDLLPESVAYDTNTKSFYVGSTRYGTITKIDEDGKQTTLVEGGSFGQWMVIGIKVDSKRNQLWFCSSGGSNLLGYDKADEQEGRPAGIFKVDLTTGELIRKYTLEAPGEVHFFNDLVIHENGDVYASHMFQEHSIYMIDRNADELELFVESDFIKYPNGMDISDDDRYLFVAHAEGIAKVDLSTGEALNLNVANDVKIKHRESIDGLYFFRNTLIGVQADLNRVTQYDLSQPLDAIMRERILVDNHPEMDHPTTGVMVEDEFYFVANAQFQKVNDDGSIDQKLSDPVILKTMLK